MRCRHPVCFVCLKDVVRDPKDYMCPNCSEYQNMYWKFNTCLADLSHISVKDNAEVAERDQTALVLEKQRKRNKATLDKLNQLCRFDEVSNDVAKVPFAHQFQNHCENMVVSGKFQSFLMKKR